MDEFQIENNIILHSCLGQINLAYILACMLDKRSAQTIFHSFTISQVPSLYFPTENIPNPERFRWACSRILIELGQNIDFSTELLINTELISSKNKSFLTIHQLLIDSKKSPLTQESKIKIAENFLILSKGNRAFSQALLSFIHQIFSSLSLQLLFSNFNFNFLDFILNPNDFDFPHFHPQFESFKNLYYYFSHPFSYLNIDTSQRFQTEIVQTHFYPDLFPFHPNIAENPLFLSIVNSTLVAQTHYIDFFNLISKASFSEKDFTKSIEDVSLPGLEIFQSWIFISHCAGFSFINNFSLYSDYMSNLLNNSQKLKTDEQFTNDKLIPLRLIEMLINDEIFIKKTKHYVGYIPEFSKLSVPNIFKNALLCNDVLSFQEFVENTHFFISDSQRTIDINFIFAYFSLSLILKLIISSSRVQEPTSSDPKTNSNTFDSNSNEFDDPEFIIECQNQLEKIELYWRQIKDTKIQQDILIDSFSLLFLFQNCKIFVVELLITFILDKCDNDKIISYVQTAHSRLQIVRLLSPNGTMADILQNRKESLREALERHDWEIAQHIIILTTIHPNFVQKYHVVYEFSQVFQNNNLLKLYNVDPIAYDEIGLSFPNQINILNSLKDSQSYIQPLIQKRIDLIDLNLHPILPMKHIDYSILFQIHKKLKNSTLSYWSIPTLTSSQINDLYSFKINMDDSNSIKISQYSKLSNENDNDNQNDNDNHNENFQQNHKIQNQYDEKVFISFFNYLDNFLSLTLNNQIANTLNDALLLDPGESIEKLLAENKIEAAEKLATSLNIDIKMQVLNGRKYSLSVIKHYSFGNKAIENAILFQSSQNDSNNDLQNNDQSNEISSLARKLVSMSKEIKQFISKEYNYSENMRDEKIKQENRRQSLRNELIHELRKNEIDQAIIEDLSYEMEETEFEDIIKNEISNIQNLLKVFPLLSSCVLKEQLYLKYELLFRVANSGFNPFPVEKCYNEIKQSGNISLLKEFDSIFIFQSNDFDSSDLTSQKSSDNTINNYNTNTHSSQIDKESNEKEFYNSLPEQWKNQQKIDQIPNIILNHLNDQKLINLLPKFPQITIDDILLDVISNSTSISEIFKNLKNYYLNLKDIEMILSTSIYRSFQLFFQNPIAHLLEHLLSQMKSLSLIIKNENKNNDILSNSNEICQKIQILHDIMTEGKMERNNINVENNNLTYFLNLLKKCDFSIERKEIGEYLAKYCQILDFPNLLWKVCENWHFSKQSYLNVIQLTQYQTSDIDFSSLNDFDKLSDNDKQQRLITTSTILNLLNPNLFFDINFIKNMKNHFPKEIFYQKLNSRKRFYLNNNVDSDLDDHINDPNTNNINDNNSKNANEKVTDKIDENVIDNNNDKNTDKNNDNNNDLFLSWNDYFLPRIHLILSKVSKDELIPPEQKQFIQTFLLSKTDPLISIKYFSFGGSFELAFELFDRYYPFPPNYSQLSDYSQILQQKRIDTFEKYIYEPAISNLQDLKLRHYIADVDPNFTHYLDCLQALLRYDNCPAIKLDISCCLNDHEEATKCAIEMFKTSENPSSSLNYLSIAQTEAELSIKNLQEIQSKRKNQSTQVKKLFFASYTSKSYSSLSQPENLNSTEKINKNKTTQDDLSPSSLLIKIEELKRLHTYIDKQRQFIICLVNHKLNQEFHEINIFDGESSRQSMALLLLKVGEYSLAIDIIEEFRINLQIIGERVLDALFNEGEESLKKLLTHFKEKLNRARFEQFAYTILNRLIYEMENGEIAKYLIRDLEESKFKCLMLCQLKELDDAYAVAISLKDPQLVGLIGNIAYKDLKPALVSKCLKYLNIG